MSRHRQIDSKPLSGFNNLLCCFKNIFRNRTSQEDITVIESIPSKNTSIIPKHEPSLSISNDLAFPNHATRQTTHDRNHSESKPQRAVRLLDLERATALNRTGSLRLGQALFTLVVRHLHKTSTPVEVIRIEDATVDYTEATAFEELFTISTKALTKNTRLPDKAFYLKVGRFRLIRHATGKAVSRGILESKEEWSIYFTSAWKISEFCGKYPNESFHVEVEWDFSSLQIAQEPGKAYAETISDALEAKVNLNWEDRKYVPQKDLARIMTEDTISKLLREDETLRSAELLTLNGGKRLEMDEFIREIWLCASRLLALCVYHELPLICLYKMRQKNLEDKHLPLSKDHCPEPEQLYRRKFDMAVKNSGGFAAHTFAPNAKGQVQHETLKADALVPIIFKLNDPDSMLGKGSFGKVYRVHIDPDHHSFSVTQNEAFALKVFYDLSEHTSENVEIESDMLSKLANVPHPNITTHLASWKQNNICYMLFRCADCNLRSFMKQPAPRLDKPTMLAMVEQMRGLADGVRHIHNLGPSNLEPERVNKTKKPSKHPQAQSCFHHDLKPANILVTRNPDTGELLFSISDFGSAKIGQILSGSMAPSPFTKNRSPGDAVYGGPDAWIKGTTSRPYDLWSIGCIFLELLTWFTDLQDANVDDFADKRLETPLTFGNQDQAFWYQDTAGRVWLKPAVQTQLRNLKAKCQGKGVLPNLVRTVSKLLNPDPDTRPEAHDLTNDLDAIMIQVQIDLQDENFYINNTSTTLHIAAPPLSSVADSEEFSRRPSISERPVFAPYANSLPVPSTPGRPRSLSYSQSSNTTRNAGEHVRHQSYPKVDTHMNGNATVAGDLHENYTPNEITTPKISLCNVDSGLEEDLLHMGHGDLTQADVK